MDLPFTNKYFFIIPVCLAIVVGCSSTEPLTENDFSPSDKEAEEIVAEIPGYTNQLRTLRGKGKAVVSEPGNTERVSIEFSSNTKKSLVTVKNSLGIEGGQMLTDSDSLFIYNKVDKFARKISIREGNLSRIDNLASLNILEIMSFSVDKEEVTRVLENETHFLLILSTRARVYVDRETYRVKQVQQPRSSRLPYSRILYENYSILEGFQLPRRITIFSADKSSKVDFLVQSLELNPELEPLALNMPDDIKVYYR